MIAIIAIIGGFISAYRRQKLWHETARIALERGQPLPPLSDEDKPKSPRCSPARSAPSKPTSTAAGKNSDRSSRHGILRPETHSARRRLGNLVRTNGTLPPLPDEGFSRRVLTALPLPTAAISIAGGFASPACWLAARSRWPGCSPLAKPRGKYRLLHGNSRSFPRPRLSRWPSRFFPSDVRFTVKCGC